MDDAKRQTHSIVWSPSPSWSLTISLEMMRRSKPNGRTEETEVRPPSSPADGDTTQSKVWHDVERAAMSTLLR